jgi:NADH dehydrogenase FAD-containing subunit
MAETTRRRVVIVGGGFAGLAAARALQDGLDVTLVDRKPHFDFLPNVHEIVSGLKKPKTVRLPLDRMARDLGQGFLQDEVEAIDPQGRLVITPSRRIPYDALILAPGGRPASRGVPGVEAHAHIFHSAEDAARIEDRLQVLAGLPGRRDVTIVGGGFTGVEVLGEVLRKYRKKQRLHVRLVDSGRRLMRDWPKVLHRRVKKLAERHDVELLLETRVAQVDADQVTLTSGRSLPSHLTIWTGGASAPRFLERSGLPLGPSGWVDVDATLSSRHFADVFVAGDASAPPKSVPKQGAEALRQGGRAAKNVKRFFRGRPLKPFRVEKDPLLVTFGDLSSFMLLEDDTVIEGPALAAGREFMFQETMAALDDAAGRRSVRRLAKRMRVSEEELGWTRSFFPFVAAGQLAGIRVHPGD